MSERWWRVATVAMIIFCVLELAVIVAWVYTADQLIEVVHER